MEMRNYSLSTFMSTKFPFFKRTSKIKTKQNTQKHYLTIENRKPKRKVNYSQSQMLCTVDLTPAWR